MIIPTFDDHCQITERREPALVHEQMHTWSVQHGRNKRNPKVENFCSYIVEYFIYIFVIIVLRFNFKGSSSPTGLQTGNSPSRRLFGLKKKNLV